MRIAAVEADVQIGDLGDQHAGARNVIDRNSPSASFLTLNGSTPQCQLAPHQIHVNIRPAELGGKLSGLRVDIIVGTRPEAIKLAPVAASLAACGPRLRIILTGQHGLNPADHGLDAHDIVRLHRPGERDPYGHAQAVARAVAPLFADRPGLLVVQGDTSSAYGAAVAAFAAAIPVAHVEAGLRTFDHKMPWPEEEMRTAIDSRATLLFAPTDVSAANLKRERVEGAVHVTGNSGIDTLLAVLERLPPSAPRPEGPLRLLVTCHRREAWDAGLRSVAKALIDLARSHPLVVDFVLHPNATIARTMRRLLEGQLGIELLNPLTHPQMIAAMRDTDILLSDSGGVQEEAPALGVPLLVLREKTERPEGIASGNMILVGTDAARIIDGVEKLLDPAVRAAMGRHAVPFGDGKAAPRIAEHVRGFLESGARSKGQARRA